MKEVISKDPNVELIQLEGDKAALAELIINKRKELIDDLSNIDREKEKANKYINEYFGKFKLYGNNLLFDFIDGDSVCDMPETTKWYKDFMDLLNNCKIKDLYYNVFKINIKAYMTTNRFRLIKKLKNKDDDHQLVLLEKLYNAKETNEFYEALAKVIEENCIENGLTKKSEFTDVIMFMIYQVSDIIANYDFFKEDTNKYLYILNLLIESITLNNSIKKDLTSPIRNTLHYKNDKELLFANELKKLSKKYNSSFAIDETNYTVGRVVKLSSFKEDNKNNSVIYVDEDKGLTALHIGAINDFVSKVTKKTLSNDEIESEIASLIAFGDVSSQIMIEEAMEKLRKQNFTHGVNKVLILLSNKLKEKDSKKVMHK